MSFADRLPVHPEGNGDGNCPPNPATETAGCGEGVRFVRVDDQSLAWEAADLVRAGWGLAVRSAASLGGGMNSATALVQLTDGRAVLKWVRGSGDGLSAGCAAARQLAQHGLLTGDPFTTLTGRLVHTTADGAVALLRFAAGDALNPDDPQDQRDIARTLAAVHAAAPVRRPGPFLNEATAGIVHDVEPWIRPSVRLVLTEYSNLPDLTWSLLHADPSPDAFLRQPDGRVALIDWTATTDGPVLYDVASALMYLGGRQNAGPFWDTYLKCSPAPAEELIEHIGTFTRYRAAVQAAYFSLRIGTQDRTGIDHDGENWKGLRDAERMLRATGARIVTQ